MRWKRRREEGEREEGEGRGWKREKGENGTCEVMVDIYRCTDSNMHTCVCMHVCARSLTM